MLLFCLCWLCWLGMEQPIGEGVMPLVLGVCGTVCMHVVDTVVLV